MQYLPFGLAKRRFSNLAIPTSCIKKDSVGTWPTSGLRGRRLPPERRHACQGAGPNGTDLVADMGLLGPPEAYQRWTKAPEYIEWRKKTNALMQAKGGQLPTGVP